MRTRGAGESALLLLDVVELLDATNIAYAVIGALAASVHGAVRASMNADVILSSGMRAASDLEREFKAAGYETELSRGDFEDPIPAMLRLRDMFDNRVDLLIGLRGMETDAFSRLVDIPFQGKILKFIGREDFVAMKVFAGGPLDLADAARVLAAGGKSLDLDLTRRLAAKFGRDALKSLQHLLGR